jgi:hypothetical protein
LVRQRSEIEVPRMRFGRLIRVARRPLDPHGTLYVVAEPDPDKAVDLLKNALTDPDGEFEDLGRITEDLLDALQLESGTFTRA